MIPLDTNVLSELMKAAPDQAVLAFIDAIPVWRCSHQRSLKQRFSTESLYCLRADGAGALPFGGAAADEFAAIAAAGARAGGQYRRRTPRSPPSRSYKVHRWQPATSRISTVAEY